jgi:hypothetical protein
MKEQRAIRTVSGLVTAIRQALPRIGTGAMSYKALRRAVNNVCTESQWAVAMHALTRDAEITVVGDRVALVGPGAHKSVDADSEVILRSSL